MSNQGAAALFILRLMVQHTGAVTGQTIVLAGSTPCTADSDCDYPGCNSEGTAHPSLEVACLSYTPLVSPHCQHVDGQGGYHACVARPSGWVAPGSNRTSCLCPALGSGITCAWTVQQLVGFSPLQDALGQCVTFLINNESVAESDALSLHCPDKCGHDNVQEAPSRKLSGTDDASTPVTVLIVAASSIAAGLW